MYYGASGRRKSKFRKPLVAPNQTATQASTAATKTNKDGDSPVTSSSSDENVSQSKEELRWHMTVSHKSKTFSF